MRLIKFRGLSMADGKTWKKGMLFKEGHELEYLVIQDSEGNESYVMPETVGQFTGKKDRKTSEEIYEGQKVKAFYDKSLIGKTDFDRGVVIWNNELGCFSVDTKYSKPTFSCFEAFEIIGDSND